MLHHRELSIFSRVWARIEEVHSMKGKYLNIIQQQTETGRIEKYRWWWRRSGAFSFHTHQKNESERKIILATDEIMLEKWETKDGESVEKSINMLHMLWQKHTQHSHPRFLKVVEEWKHTLIKESKAFRCYVMEHTAPYYKSFVNGPCLLPSTSPLLSFPSRIFFHSSPRDALLSHLKYTRKVWKWYCYGEEFPSTW